MSAVYEPVLQQNLQHVHETIKTATGEVNVSQAADPTTGQVLTATDSTHATWQTPSGGGGSSFNGSILTFSATISVSINSTSASQTYQITSNGANYTLNATTAGTIGQILNFILFNTHASNHAIITFGTNFYNFNGGAANTFDEFPVNVLLLQFFSNGSNWLLFQSNSYAIFP